MAEECPSPSLCLDNVITKINECILNLINSNEDGIAEAFDDFCIIQLEKGPKATVINEAATKFAEYVKGAFDSINFPNSKADSNCDGKIDRIDQQWNSLYKKYFSICGIGDLKTLFKNRIVPTLLANPYGEFIDMCNSLKNIKGTLCDAESAKCWNDVTGWITPAECVMDLGYKRSTYYNNDNKLNITGKKMLTRLCDGIQITYSAIPPEDPIWDEYPNRTPCTGGFVLKVMTSVENDAEDSLAPPIYKSKYIYLTANEAGQKYKEAASVAASKYKTAMLEAVPLLYEMIDTASNNRDKLIANLQASLNNILDHNELKIQVLELFFAQLGNATPISPCGGTLCKCMSDYLWGGGGSTCPGLDNGGEGVIWFNNAAVDECVRKLRDTLHPLGEQGPIGTHTVSKFDYPTMTAAIATQAVQAKGGAQCGSARALAFVANGDNWLITYRFDPCLLWYPSLYQVDKCTSEKIHKIMAKMVDALNKTRTPNCKFSLMHNWVMNKMPGTAPEGEFFGFGGTIAGGNDACLYSWPNETNNGNRDGTDVGGDSQPVALPTNCSIYPNFMGQGDRFRFFLNLYFVTLFYKHYSKKPALVYDLLDRLTRTLIDQINMLEKCPSSTIECIET
jgi:hypothetical protein